MKAISLWEPWASLIRTGAKKFETRSWPTKYRGPLLICASKGGLSCAKLNDLLDDPNFQKGLSGLNGEKTRIGISHLNFGKAVAVVNLINCLTTESVVWAEQLTKEDRAFGDWGIGRYAWKLELIEAIEPFPVKGHQGFFEVNLS
jgi:hypothetical protein